MAAVTTCPYCNRNVRSRDNLRGHVATNECGKVPDHVAAVFLENENPLEDDYRKQAEKVARAHGWLVCHVERSRGRDGRWLTAAAPGFPDNWFVHPSDGRILVVEFKSKRGRTSPEQREWLAALELNPSVVVMVGRPDGWPALQAALTAVS